MTDFAQREAGFEPDGANGVLIVDVKTGAEKRPGAEAQADVAMNNSFIGLQTRDRVGRLIVMIGGSEYTDDGENLTPANRTPSSAYYRSATDYGA